MRLCEIYPFRPSARLTPEMAAWLSEHDGREPMRDVVLQFVREFAVAPSDVGKLITQWLTEEAK